MKRSRFIEKQIIRFLKKGEAGSPVEEIFCRGGFSDATFYKRPFKSERLKTSSELNGQNDPPETASGEYLFSDAKYARARVRR